MSLKTQNEIEEELEYLYYRRTLYDGSNHLGYRSYIPFKLEEIDKEINKLQNARKSN